MQGLIKQECVAVKRPENQDEARKRDMLEKRQVAIYEERDRKLDTARMNRNAKRLERQKQAS